MPHDRHAHAVAADVIGVVIALGKQVIVVQSHEPRRFARRQQARPHCLPFNHQDYLTRGAARWRAKTARHIVETNLCALALDPVFVWAGAPIHGADHFAAASDRVRHLLAIERRHEVQNVVRMRGGVPLHCGRRVFDEVSEGGVSRQWPRDVPPDPISLRRRRDAGVSLDERCGMPAFLRILGDQ